MSNQQLTEQAVFLQDSVNTSVGCAPVGQDCKWNGPCCSGLNCEAKNQYESYCQIQFNTISQVQADQVCIEWDNQACDNFGPNFLTTQTVSNQGECCDLCYGNHDFLCQSWTYYSGTGQCSLFKNCPLTSNSNAVSGGTCMSYPVTPDADDKCRGIDSQSAWQTECSDEGGEQPLRVRCADCCEGAYNPAAVQPVDCVGSFGSWDTCSESCGGGTQTRTYDVTTAASGGGTDCNKNDGETQSQICGTTACPESSPSSCVGSWALSSCSVSCGTGSAIKTFSVLESGSVCEANDGDTEAVECNDGECPPNLTDEPGATGDPHFHGFDGSRYDFQGSPGVVFNLITDESFQLNARFVESPIDGNTYMGVIGLRVGSNKIIVTPDATVVNNDSLTKGQHVMLTMKGGDHVGMVIRTDRKVRVKSSGFQIEITFSETDGFLHLDFDSAAESDHLVHPHGILGQTAQFMVDGTDAHPVHLTHKNVNSQGFLDGTPSDYIVADGLLGTEFAFNRFGKPSGVSKGLARRQFSFARAFYKEA